MDHAAFMGRLQRFGHLFADRERVLHGHRSDLQSFGEGITLDQFHNQKVYGLARRGLLPRRLRGRRRRDDVRLKPVDRRDVGMVQRCEYLRLSLKPGHPLRITRKKIRQHLDRHLAIQARVAGAIDLPHPARPDGSENLIGA